MSRNPLWKNWWPAGFLDTIFLKTGGRVDFYGCTWYTGYPQVLNFYLKNMKLQGHRPGRTPPSCAALRGHSQPFGANAPKIDPYRRERTYGYVGLATARRFFLCVFSGRDQGVLNQRCEKTVRKLGIEPLRQHMDPWQQKNMKHRETTKPKWRFCVPKTLHSWIFLY